MFSCGPIRGRETLFMAAKKGEKKTARPKQKPLIYQLKVTLEGLKPSIWRRLEVPGDFTLGELH